MRLLSTFCILSFSFVSFSSLAASTKNLSFNDQFIGISHNLSQQELSIYINQNKIIKNLSRLQKAGLIDSNLTNTEAGFFEPQLSAQLSIHYVTKIIHSLYLSNTKNDPIHVTSYLLTTDLYGNKTTEFCYSFNFNRELYQKINWNDFQANNIVKIAPNFKTSKTCKVLKDTSPLSI